MLVLASIEHAAGGKPAASICIIGSDGGIRFQLDYAEKVVAVRLEKTGVFVAANSSVAMLSLDGKMLWRNDIDGGKIVSCRRLLGGTMLVATEQAVVEFTQVSAALTHSRAPHQVGPVPDARARGAVCADAPFFDAVRRSGQLLVYQHQSYSVGPAQFASLSTFSANTGKLMNVKRWWHEYAECVDRPSICADGSVLTVVPGHKAIRLNEFGPCWECDIPGIQLAVELRGGRILVATAHGEIEERDREGRVIWKRHVGGLCTSIMPLPWPLRFGYRRDEAFQATDCARFLMNSLKDKNKTRRYVAILGLRELGPQASIAARPLVNALADVTEMQGGVSIADVAGEALVGIGEACIPEVLNGLKNGNQDIRGRCLSVLTALRNHIPSLSEHAIKCLDDPVSDVRVRALETLQLLGPQGIGAIPKLRAMIRDPILDRKILNHVGATLGRIGIEAKVAVPEIITRLNAEGPDVPPGVVSALGDLGSGNQEAIRALIDAFEQGDKGLRRAAARALGKLKTEQAVLPFVNALKKRPANEAHFEIVLSLGEIGAQAARSVPELVQILGAQDADIELHGAVITALGRIGPGARQAVPELKRIEDPRLAARLDVALRMIAEAK
jgi:HEAT repeat protein